MREQLASFREEFQMSQKLVLNSLRGSQQAETRSLLEKEMQSVTDLQYKARASQSLLSAAVTYCEYYAEL
jgi:hypothetical protein